MAKRAMVIAASGRHGMLMVGPPGAGKTMLARRMPGILPPLTEEERAEALPRPLRGRTAHRGHSPGSEALQGSPPLHLRRRPRRGRPSCASRRDFPCGQGCALPGRAPRVCQQRAAVPEAARLEDREVRGSSASTASTPFPATSSPWRRQTPVPAGTWATPATNAPAPPLASSRIRPRSAAPSWTASTSSATWPGPRVTRS